jgi:hypothetical protein
MKTVDRLNELLASLLGEDTQVQVVFHHRTEGDVNRGYHLDGHLDESWSRPGSARFNQWVNGEWIGNSYEDARAEILRRYRQGEK